MSEPRLCEWCRCPEEPPEFVWRPFVCDDVTMLLCNGCQDRAEIVDEDDDESEEDDE
jgi:hypothetical protein